VQEDRCIDGQAVESLHHCLYKQACRLFGAY